MQITEKLSGYYILSEIDYVNRKFIELKKIEADIKQSDDKLISNSFEVLGISKKGELLESK